MFLTRLSSKLLKTGVKISKKASTTTFSVQPNRPCSSAATSTESLVSLYGMRKTLKAAGQEVEEGTTCIQTTCPVCCFDAPKTAEKIYINKITGNFVCPACHHKGGWSLLERFLTAPKKLPNSNELKKYQELFLDAKRKQPPTVFPVDGLPALSSFTPQQLDAIAEHFDLELPSSSLLRLTGALYDEAQQILYVPLIDVAGQTTGFKLLRRSSDTAHVVESTLPEQNTSGLVIVSPAVVGARGATSKDAILVLSLFDVLALATQKIKETVVCLPYGMKSLPQECLPALDKYQKLILWFNYDTAGWDTARIYGKKLDEKRCMFVRPMDAHPTPYNALAKSLDIRAILNKSQPILHKAITTFGSLRQDVLSELQNRDKALGVKWKRYPTLNKLIKGHRKGELTILTGPTGCGKTTFMSEYSLDLACQGVNTLWGSFEIRNTRLASTLLRQLAGRPLDDNIADFDHWADQFERLPIYFMTFHGQQPIKIVMDAIDHAQYVHDIHHVIIDNVQFMMGMSDEAKHNDRFWKQDSIISAFRTFATRKNCHVTLVIHPRKERDDEDLTTSSIFGSAKATQEADNVLIIQDKRLTSVRGKKYLQVAKNRFSGDLGIMPLDFDKLGLSYAQKARSKRTDEGEAVAASKTAVGLS